MENLEKKLNKSQEKYEREIKKLYLDLRDCVISSSVKSKSSAKEQNNLINKIARLYLKKDHFWISSKQQNEIEYQIRNYVEKMQETADNYKNKQVFDNAKANMVYFRDFCDSCNDLEKFLKVHVTKQDMENSYNGVIVRIKEPLTPENMYKFLECYVESKEKDDGFYGVLMGANKEEEKHDVNEYKKMRNNVYKKEIEMLLSLNKKEQKALSRKYYFRSILAKLDVFTLFGEGIDMYKAKIRSCFAGMVPFTELKGLVEQYGVDGLLQEYDRICDKLEKDNDVKFSAEENQIFSMIDYHIRRGFHNFPGILSFFISREMFDKNCKDDTSVDVRLYINIESKDLYKFTQEYVDKAMKDDMYFHIKVLDAKKDSPDRAEKLVIYSSKEDLQRNIQIVEQIRKEHPDFNYKKPPITAGNIDEWIGIGSEPIDCKLGASYNTKRAGIIKQAISETFKDIETKDILKLAKSNPQYLDELYENIKKVSLENGVNEKHFSLEEGDADYLNKKLDNLIFVSGVIPQKSKVEKQAKDSSSYIEKNKTQRQISIEKNR